MKNRILMTVAGVIATLTVGAPAFAFRGGGDMTNMSMIRHDTDPQKLIKLVRLEGLLSCDLGAQNNGQGCELKLTESKTGRIYNLIEAHGAMELFQDGRKNVIIEGRLADAETIAVKSVQTL